MFRKLFTRVKNKQLECRIEKLRCQVDGLESDHIAFKAKIRKEENSNKKWGIFFAVVSLACSLIISYNLENMVETPILGVPGVVFAAKSSYGLSLFALYLATRSTGKWNLLLVIACIAVSITVTP